MENQKNLSSISLGKKHYLMSQTMAGSLMFSGFLMTKTLLPNNALTFYGTFLIATVVEMLRMDSALKEIRLLKNTDFLYEAEKTDFNKFYEYQNDQKSCIIASYIATGAFLSAVHSNFNNMLLTSAVALFCGCMAWNRGSAYSSILYKEDLVHQMEKLQKEDEQHKNNKLELMGPQKISSHNSTNKQQNKKPQKEREY